MLLTYGLNDDDVEVVSQVSGWGLPVPSESEVRSLVQDAGFDISAITYLEGDYPARYIETTKPA